MTHEPETIQIFFSPRAEYSCVWNALYVYLGRPPLEDDLKLLSQLPSKTNPNRFTLFYKKKKMGIIRMMYRIDEKDPIKVSYTPLALLN